MYIKYSVWFVDLLVFVIWRKNKSTWKILLLNASLIRNKGLKNYLSYLMFEILNRQSINSSQKVIWLLFTFYENTFVLYIAFYVHYCRNECVLNTFTFDMLFTPKERVSYRHNKRWQYKWSASANTVLLHCGSLTQK